MSVGSQLNAFSDDLNHQLSYHMVEYVNLILWFDTDFISPESLRAVEGLIRSCFRDLIMSWKHTPVLELIYECRRTLELAARVALNVPFPGDSLMHIEAVGRNLFDLFFDEFYTRMYTEMIKVSHGIGQIQRTWKRAISDPKHPICIRRLKFELEEMTV